MKNPKWGDQPFASIAAETLNELFDKHGEDFEKHYILVDCRYQYEYQGGHIRVSFQNFKFKFK